MNQYNDDIALSLSLFLSVLSLNYYQTGVSFIAGNGLEGPELAEFGLAKLSGVIEVILLRPPSKLLLGEAEFLDWPATIDSEPIPDINGASEPRFIIPIESEEMIKLRLKNA